MNVSFNGFSEQVLTFMAETDIAEGTPVDAVSGGYVEAPAAGLNFSGVVVRCSGGYASVLMHGVVTVKCTDSSIAEGLNGLVSDGSGGVKAANDGIMRVVLGTDTDNETVTILM